MAAVGNMGSNVLVTTNAKSIPFKTIRFIVSPFWQDIGSNTSHYIQQFQCQGKEINAYRAKRPRPFSDF
jgi:hypothetical protein